MDATVRVALWRQFGAALDMLENAVIACPADLWDDRSMRPEFWYLAFHTLFFADLSCFGRIEGFAPPSPFSLNELEYDGIVGPYAKDDILRYVEHVRERGRTAVAALTDQGAQELRRFPWVELNACELFLYNLRHVQHHTAQMNLILRQVTNSAPDWVKAAKDRL
jgi:hypothetical protein